MNNKLIAILAVIMVLAMAAFAFAAGGAGPSKGTRTGEFISASPADNSAVFVQSGKTEQTNLVLGTGISAESLPINKKVMINVDEHKGNVVTEVSLMFIGMTLEKIIALLIIGLVGGLLSGFIGSGGAFVLTPAMMSLGAPGAVAVASNMCHKFPKAMVGAYKRFKYGQVDLKLGITMAISAIVGVQIGIQIQKAILNAYGNAGSNLYVSVVFVVVLILVGGYVLRDAMKLKNKSGAEEHTRTNLSIALQKINIPPMMDFKVAGVRMSAWVTIPIGLATGMLAATIAVGGFIGVPGMIYIVGASAIVASATELVVAFIMGFWGSVQWGLSGLIDIRMAVLLLAGSLFGVQLGAIGTTYVKDYTVKLVMAATMLIVAVSRGAKVPLYLSDLNMVKLSDTTAVVLNQISFWALAAALATASIIIAGAMIKGIAAHKSEKATSVAHGNV